MYIEAINVLMWWLSLSSNRILARKTVRRSYAKTCLPGLINLRGKRMRIHLSPMMSGTWTRTCRQYTLQKDLKPDGELLWIDLKNIGTCMPIFSLSQSYCYVWLVWELVTVKGHLEKMFSVLSYCNFNATSLQKSTKLTLYSVLFRNWLHEKSQHLSLNRILVLWIELIM